MRLNIIQSLAAILITVLFAATGMTAGLAGPQVTVDISGHPFKGPVNAPVTVIVFSDYL